MTPEALKKKFEAIAKEHGVKTLETQNSDSLDFHEISVWDLRNMLIMAYEAGKEDG